MLEIQSQFHPYCVEVKEGLKDALTQAVKDKTVFTLVDSNVFHLYSQPIEEVLSDRPLLKIEATEEQKSFEQLTPIFLNLLELGFRKDCTLLVIGGGVIQDIGCFIASVLFRGIKWILIPTTLLAQCDSCIGSKSSINIQNFKNQIGTFYPPHEIILVFSVLKTLPSDEIRSGLGEIIKLNLLAGQSEVQQMKINLQKLSSDFLEIQNLILDALNIKKRYIERDEFDKGIRNILNYGHTFGHAYESATNYKIPHGIAVTLGVLTATFFSERLGMVESGYFDNLQEFLKPYYEPYNQELTSNILELILGAIKLDKKNTGRSINCILTRGEGKMEKVSLELENQVRPLLKEFLTVIC
jgi:3-dehydroquinate synthase